MTATRRLVASTLMLAAAAPVDEVGGVLAALRHGLHAHGPAERARAGAALRRLGARPLDDEPDRAARWDPAGAPPYRDRALGPGYRVLTLPAGGRLHLDQTFLAGQRAEVAATADPSLAFDLAVGVAGTRIDCAPAAAGRRCSWVPDYTARYAIDLTSRGARPARFAIVLR